MHLAAGDIIAIIFGALAIVASLVAGTYWWTHRGEKKEISYDYSSARLTATETHPFTASVEILVDGRPVTDVSIVTIGVRNSGTKEIRPEDFIDDRDLKFTLPDSEVLSVAAGGYKPWDLNVALYYAVVPKSSHVSLDPLLLNAGDEFTIYLLVSHFSGQIEASGRIAGVKQIKRVTKADDPARTITTAFISQAAVGVVIGSIWIVSGHFTGGKKGQTFLLMGSLILIASVGLLLSAIMWRLWSRRLARFRRS